MAVRETLGRRLKDCKMTIALEAWRDDIGKLVALLSYGSRPYRSPSLTAMSGVTAIFRWSPQAPRGRDMVVECDGLCCFVILLFYYFIHLLSLTGILDVKSLRITRQLTCSVHICRFMQFVCACSHKFASSVMSGSQSPCLVCCRSFHNQFQAK